MRIKLGTTLIVFVWCMFMGITAGSIGLGAAFPDLNRIVRPFLCPNGKMDLDTKTYTPTPIETVTTLTWYCVDSKTGARQEMGLFPMSMIAGSIYGFLFFVVVYAVMWFMAGRSASPESPAGFTDMVAPRKAATSAVDMDDLSDLVARTAETRDNAERLRRQIEENLGKRAAGDSGSTEHRLAKLKSLLDQGLITEQDYNQKKQEILKKI